MQGVTEVSSKCHLSKEKGTVTKVESLLLGSLENFPKNFSIYINNFLNGKRNSDRLFFSFVEVVLLASKGGHPFRKDLYSSRNCSFVGFLCRK